MDGIETFRRLARSAPWLWRSMRLTHDEGDGRPVRAWIRRPDSLRVETPDGHLLHASPGDRVPPGYSVLTVADPSEDGVRPLAAELEPPQPVWWTDPDAPRPRLDPQGLVVEPMSWQAALSVDDAMWVNYRWVAMLNPRELADGQDGAPAVAVDSLSAGVRHGRPTLFATVRPLPGYDPRCGCCPLLPSRESEIAEGARDPHGPFAEAHRVALDIATGVCVAAHEVGGPRHGAGFDVVIEAVDEEYEDQRFTPTPESELRGRFDPNGSLVRPEDAVPGVAPRAGWFRYPLGRYRR